MWLVLSSATTATWVGAPAIAGLSGTRKRCDAVGVAVTVNVVLPVIGGVELSVAVTVSVPAALGVNVKAWMPWSLAENVNEPGSVSPVPVLVRVTVPV